LRLSQYRVSTLKLHWKDSVMTKTIVTTERAPRSGAYSQAVKAAGLIFVSGQGPFDPETGHVVGTTVQEQTARCLRNIEAILQAAGSSLQKIVSATFILGDPADFAGLNEEWMRWFPKDPPARQGAKLPLQIKDMRISIAVVAEA
jgi:2-iminobutanoate/2-iminopropanoate deaminase